VGLLPGLGVITGLGPALVRSSARTSWDVTRAGVSASQRLAGRLVAAPAPVVRAALGGRGDRERQVWSMDGRAQVEVWGPSGSACARVLAEVQRELRALPGVEWAAVDAVTRRAVVRFDPARLTEADLLRAVGRGEDAAREAAAGDGDPVPGGYRPDEPSFPGDAAPVRAQALALAADAVGLSAAVVGQVARLPSLPGSAAAAVVLVDNQPRLRRLLESKLGPAATDLALALSMATVQALTQSAPSLLVDAAQRGQGLLAARARRDGFTRREAELSGPERPVRGHPLSVAPRPVPLPPGSVERHADRAAAGSLLAAGGVLAAAANLDLAGRVLLIGAPRASRAAREAFADTLTAGLSRRGVVVRDPAAIRRLDRVTTVLVDSAVLHDERPLVLSAQSLSGGWTEGRVWSAAQRLLWYGEDLRLPSARPGQGARLALTEQPSGGTGAVSRFLLTEQGVAVGEALVGRELDGHADAVLSAAGHAGLRLVLTKDAAGAGMTGRADEVVDGGGDLAEQVRRLQADGQVVVVLSRDEDALAAADVGVGLVPPAGRVPWAADVLCGPGLLDVPRLLAAAPAAAAVSAHGVTMSLAGTFLGGLLTAVGGPGRAGRALFPVTIATGSALLSGTLTARRVNRLPPPEAVLHTPWHALEPDEVLARLPAPPLPAPDRGNDDGHAGRGPVVGALRVPQAAVAGLAALAANVRAELADPLTPVLATGAAASAAVGSPTDAFLVGGVLAGNAVISGVQRLRADRALRTLLLDQRLSATVVDRSGRDGHRVPAAALRPGHVIEVGPGDVVPADARLLSENELEVDEASLTGESVPVGKQTRAAPGAELADRACLLYQGTTVLAGSARAVVVAVGSGTEAGRAVALAARAAAPRGMQARLEELTRRGLPVTLLGGGAVTGLALLRRQPIRAAISSGVSVAVAAVPEGLPLVATVAQLGAARRLSARGVLVRSPRTVEALGRVDTVCFDKTGTLTQGRLRLARLAGLSEDWAPEAAQGRRVLRAAARACPHGGDQRVPHATDQAIIDAAARILGDQAGDADWEELSELPFQSDRGFSAAVGRTSGKTRLVVKGAPEVLLPRCTHERDDTGKRRLDRAGREAAAATVQSLAGQGLRVLAVARRNVTDVVAGGAPTEDEVDPGELTEDLTLLGFVALADLPRPQAAATVTALHAAGLSTIMITGDHPVTAAVIASRLGIPAARVVTGPELAGLDESARAALVSQGEVFARVSPEQKLQIISALQASGRVVAMTGDGANDAAAIRLADVGIGMAAHGSVSARTAADLVLTRPDVSLILDSLVEGRAMWGRVRDAVAILLGGNAGEVAFTLMGTALAGRAPIGTRQFLLVNLLTDLLPSMAIALAATPDAPLERRGLLRAGVPSLGAPLLTDIAIRGAATSVGALAAWQLGRVTGRRTRASTMALAALVGTQLGQTLLVARGNPLVLTTGIGSAAALTGIIQIPGLSHFFGCTPLGPVGWVTVTGCATAATVLAAVAPRLLPPTAEPRAGGAEPAPPAWPRRAAGPVPRLVFAGPPRAPLARPPSGGQP